MLGNTSRSQKELRTSIQRNSTLRSKLENNIKSMAIQFYAPMRQVNMALRVLSVPLMVFFLAGCTELPFLQPMATAPEAISSSSVGVIQATNSTTLRCSLHGLDFQCVYKGLIFNNDNAPGIAHQLYPQSERALTLKVPQNSIFRMGGPGSPVQGVTVMLEALDDGPFSTGVKFEFLCSDASSSAPSPQPCNGFVNASGTTLTLPYSTIDSVALQRLFKQSHSPPAGRTGYRLYVLTWVASGTGLSPYQAEDGGYVSFNMGNAPGAAGGTKGGGSGQKNQSSPQILKITRTDQNIPEDSVIVGSILVNDYRTQLQFLVGNQGARFPVAFPSHFPRRLIANPDQAELKFVVGCNRTGMTAALKKSLDAFRASKGLAVLFGIGSSFYIDVIAVDHVAKKSVQERLYFNCVSNSTSSLAPVISSIQSPYQIPVHTKVEGAINFSDANGDVVQVDFIEVQNFASSNWDPNARGIRSGTIKFFTTCSEVGVRSSADVYLTDQAGNTSNIIRFNFICVGGEVESDHELGENDYEESPSGSEVIPSSSATTSSLRK